MLARLLILFTIVPFVELALLIWFTEQTNLLTTIATVLVTGFAGAALARWQGFKAWNAVRSDLAAGRLPAASIVDGVLILVAGALLVSPGLITDACGFLLLIPRIRAVARGWLVEYFKRRVTVRFESLAARAAGFAPGDVIDAEFRRTDAAPIERRTQ
jgi:UPF0716 protein FxsA